MSGVGPRAREIRVSSEGDGETGNVILEITDRLVFTMVQSSRNSTKRTVQTKTVGKRSYLWFRWTTFESSLSIPSVIFTQDLSLHAVSPESDDDENNLTLSARGQTLEMNFQALANANNGENDFIKHTVCIHHPVTFTVVCLMLHGQVLLQLPL